MIEENTCSDCPPFGYPNDKTRCLPCPRRAQNALDAKESLGGCDIPDDSPYCECNDQPSMEEVDWNKCDACGKPLE